MAYAHLFFNLTGIIIWYSIWPLRAVPIGLAKVLGNITAKYRWFALAYLAVCFFIVPAVFMGFSLWGDVPLLVLITLCVVLAVFVTLVNVLQARRPEWLPHKLRTWAWLPEPLRSLRPYDQYIFKPLGESLTKCCSCAKDNFKSKHSGGAALSDVKFNTRERTADANELAVAAQRMA